MSPTVLLFLSSGLFLGWSLGANDAANVFGTAVGSRMIRFGTAAIICSVCLILGAVVSGAGAAHGLGKLGAVNALAGSFVVACSAALTVYWMTRASLPVSATQAIVGAIIGWNFFSGHRTDYSSLLRIALSWAASPALTAVLAIVLYVILKQFVGRLKIHLLWLDFLTRAGLLIACVAGGYSLGANNIANVMGVFVGVSPFKDLAVFNILNLTGRQQLFLLGGLAIALGVLTYSRRVIETVGCSIFRLSPGSALVIVSATAIVMFLFSSVALSNWLAAHGLPQVPLVPVSSSQAVVGGIVGIGLVKGARGIRYRILAEIAAGWVATPMIAGVLAFIALFFLQNVFNLTVR